MKIRPVKKVQLVFVSCHLFAVERSHQLVREVQEKKSGLTLTAESATGHNSLDSCNN